MQIQVQRLELLRVPYKEDKPFLSLFKLKKFVCLLECVL
jgi:hypothetical protein